MTPSDPTEPTETHRATPDDIPADIRRQALDGVANTHGFDTWRALVEHYPQWSRDTHMVVMSALVAIHPSLRVAPVQDIAEFATMTDLTDAEHASFNAAVTSCRCTCKGDTQ